MTAVLHTRSWPRLLVVPALILLLVMLLLPAGASAGTATFGEIIITPTGSDINDSNDGPQRSALGDFNGDGNLDIVFTLDGPESLRMMLGDGAGGFSVPSQVPIDSDCAVRAVDVNADGSLTS